MRLSRKIILTCTFFSLGLASMPAFAQYERLNRLSQQLMDNSYYRANREMIIDTQYTYKFMYERWVAKAHNYGKGEFPFHKIVEPYAKGPDYDPYSEDTLNVLYEHAYMAENAPSENEKLLAIDKFKDLLDDHYGNLEVVTAGISLVRQNKDLGDLKFLNWLRAGLVERALTAGPGVDLFTAYDLYTSGEELLILRQKNAKVIEFEELSDGEHYYRIYTIEDKDSGSPSKVYFNFTQVMRGLIDMETLKDPYYKYTPNIPR